MRRFRLRPRTWIALGVVGVVAAALSVAGYAYFSATGSGSGNAYTAAASQIVISGDANSAYLYPGGPAVPITVHVVNNGNGTQYVGQISGAISSPLNLCDPSWFTITAPVVGYLAGNGASVDVPGSISMPENDNQNQSSCAGQTLTIAWSSTG